MMSEQKEVTNDIRRKLLKTVIYAPPVILGSMVATPRTVMGAIGKTEICNLVAGGAVSIVVSSGTNACCPCVQGSVKFDPVKCAKDQCIKSCGVNCAPGQIATLKCKDFCKNCGTTPAGCRKPCKKGCFPDPKKPGQFKCK